MDTIFYVEEIYKYIDKKNEVSRSELVMLLKEFQCTDPEHILAILPTSSDQIFRDSNNPSRVFRPPFVLETIKKASLFRKRVVNPVGH